MKKLAIWVRIFILILFSIIFGTKLLAEGSYHTGMNQPLFQYTTTSFSLNSGIEANIPRPLYVDVLNSGEVVNIHACGEDNDDDIDIEIWSEDGTTQIGSTFQIRNTTDAGHVDCADTFAGNLTNPIQVNGLAVGTYQVRFTTLTADTGSAGFFLNRYNIAVNNGSTTINPQNQEGRVWTYRIAFFSGAFAQSASTDADYTVVVDSGYTGSYYLWQLDLDDFSGYRYEIMANNLGVDSPNDDGSIVAGLSVCMDGITPATAGANCGGIGSAADVKNQVSPLYKMYLNFPAKSYPAPTQTPEVTNFYFIDDDNEDNTISPGSTTGVQDIGTFNFTTNLETNGTYELIIDVDGSGTYGAGDVFLRGLALPGVNTVIWNGQDNTGTPLPVGNYRAIVNVRTGEYHFAAVDAEISGGGVGNGLTIHAVDNTTGGTSPATIYWDDQTSRNLNDANSFNLTGILGGFHSWGAFNTPGNEDIDDGNLAIIDTYVYGVSDTPSVPAVIVIAENDDPLNMVLTKTSTPANNPLQPGDTIDYTITIENNETVPINNIVVTDTLSADATLNGACNVNGFTYNTTVGTPKTASDAFPTNGVFSTGTNWVNDWQEIGESDGAGRGDIRVTGNELRLKDNDNGGEGVSRTVDFTGYNTTATLSFDYREVGLDNANDNVVVSISIDGGAFTEVVRLDGGDGNQNSSFSGPITVGDTTVIRFLTSSSMGNNDSIFFDNINITATQTIQTKVVKNMSCNAFDELVSASDAFILEAADTMTITYQALVADPVTVGVDEINNTVIAQSDEIGFREANTSDPVLVFVTVSGNVFDDADGLTDSTVDGTAIQTASGSQLYVNLVDGSNNVAAVATVAADGTYTFPSILQATYAAELSTIAGSVGNAAPAQTLPSSWINTGEDYGSGNGAGSGVDTPVADGSVSITIGSTNVTAVNFGIEQIPTANNVPASSQANPGGTAQVTVPTLGGIDPEDGALGSGDTVVIETLATNGTLYYSGAAVTAGQTIPSYDPTLLTLDPVDGSVTASFTYSVVDAAGVSSPAATVSMPFVDGVVLDYGDLPSPYATLLADDGPRHSISGDSTIYLGNTAPDAESDGQPTADADGDASGNDDEDGITFLNPMVAGASSDLNVTASAGCNAPTVCTVSIFFDFNNNGNFNDTDEVITATVTGGNNTITYNVPNGTDVNAPIFMMARLTTDGVVGATGYASDGEVEAFKIDSPSTLPVTISYVYPKLYGNNLEVAFSTATEVGNIGFNVYAIKGKKGKRWVKLNEELIVSKVIDSFTPTDYQVSLALPDTMKRVRKIGIAGVDIDGIEDRHGAFKIGHESGVKTSVVAIDWNKIQREVKADKKARKAKRKAARKARKAARKSARKSAKSSVRRLFKEEVVHLDVDSNAVYRLTHEELLLQGIDFRGFKANNIAISFKGKGVARHIEGLNKKGKWTKESAIEFVGAAPTGSDALYLTSNRYQLSLSKKLVVESEAIEAITRKELVFEHNTRYSNMSPSDDPFHDGTFFTQGYGEALVTKTFEMNTVEADSYEMTVYLSAVSSVQHHLVVSLNGEELTELKPLGREALEINMEVEGSKLQEGVNTLTIRVVGEGAAYDIYTYDKVVLEYDDGVSVDSKIPTMILSDKIKSKTIKPKRRTNYMIISHPLFMGEILEHYVSQRQGEGWKIQVVNVEDIYDVYGYGMATPDAIKAYLKIAQAKGVTHVQLVGAANYDYHDYLGYGSVSFIPSIYTTTAGFVSYTPSDTLYVADESGLPQMAIGRWPVRTLEGLNAVINKSLDWKNSGQSSAKTALFIADKNDGKLDFKEQIEQIAYTFEVEKQWNNISRVYLDDFIVQNGGNMGDAVNDARDAIGQALDNGPSITSYNGHSAPSTWSYDGLLRESDINVMQNEGNPTLALPLACYTSYADSPFVNTMAHQFLAEGEHGAVAIYGATLFSSYVENGMITSEVIDHLFNGETLGEAVLKAKRELGIKYLDTILNGSLLGDVTLRLE